MLYNVEHTLNTKEINMQVKFPMNENVWGLVVEQADEQMFVENQGV